MTAIAYLGDLGSGKTTKGIRDTILTKKLHPEKTIYSNIHINNFPYQPLDLMDLYLNHKEEKNIIIFADEFYTMMDSRISSSHRSIIESYFVAMTRKVNCDFYITMQYEKFVDCRIAPFIKIKYIMEGIPVTYSFYLDGQKFFYKKNHPYLFKMTLFDERTNPPFITEKLFNGLRWFKEFNTNEVVLPPKDIILNVKLKQLEKEVKYKKLLLEKNDLDAGNYVKKSKKKNSF